MPVPDAYLTSLWNTPLPSQIINGELSIKMNSKTIQDDYPLMGMPNYSGDKREFNTIELKNPKWIAPGKPMDAAIKVAHALTDGWLKIAFIGSEIRPY